MLPACSPQSSNVLTTTSMSHQHTVEPSLPVPGHVVTSFVTIFNDPDKDPTGGNSATLLWPFVHNIAYAANTASTKAIKNQVTQWGHKIT